MLYGADSSNYLLFFSCNDIEKDKNEALIEEFSRFEEGWDFGGGWPFSEQTISNARSIYQYGKRKGLLSEVFPGTEGEIVISFQKDDEFIDITIRNDGKFEIEHEKGIGEDFTSENLGIHNHMKEVEEQINWLRNLHRENSSESSTYYTLAKIKSGSEKVLLSGGMEAFQFLMINAEKNNTVTQCVST